MNLQLKKLFQYIVIILAFKKIKIVFDIASKFDLRKPTASDVNKMIKSLDPNKATGPDGFPAKFVQMPTTFIDCHLSNIITCDISKTKYSECAKIATVRPVFKKDDRTKIKNNRHESLFNMLSKICEKLLHENLTNYVNIFLSKFISAYRKSYSTKHVLIRSTGNWKKTLGEKKIVGAVLTDL